MPTALVILNLHYGSIKPYSKNCGSQPNLIIDNIIDISKEYDDCFIINDSHSSNDVEFEYIPNHSIVGKVETSRLLYVEKKLQSKSIQFLNKNTLSAIHNPHNRGIILNKKYDTIVIAGFLGSTDIVATCIDLIDEKQIIAIVPSAIDDYSLYYKEKTISYLNFIGIKSI